MEMAELYARKVSTKLVGQMAEVAGFDLAHGNAIDAVSDVMIRFIQEVGETSKSYAELQGRTDVNALDVVEVLQDFNMDCSKLLQFAKEEPSDPFLHTVAPFPVYRTALQPPSFKDTGAERPTHIPEHLPAFPAPHTMQFTPMKPQEPDQAATEEATEEPPTALQSQEALIHLRQKMQAFSAGVRPNPFLALQSKALSESREKESAAPGQQGLDMLDAFGPVLKKSRAQQDDGPGRGGDLAQAGPSSVPTRAPDSHMADADEPGSPQGGWDDGEVDVAAMHVSDDALQRGGRVLLSLDPAGMCSELAMKERYRKSAQDAFLKDSDAAAAVAGGSRRRGAAHDPDSAKRARAQDILDRGPDSILMEYPEGHVPRSGT